MPEFASLDADKSRYRFADVNNPQSSAPFGPSQDLRPSIPVLPGSPSRLDVVGGAVKEPKKTCPSCGKHQTLTRKNETLLNQEQPILEGVMIQRGDIFIWEGDNVFAWGIQKLTQSKWSHTGFCLGEGKMLDADWDGVKIRDFKPYTDHPERLKIIRPPVGQQNRIKALNEAMKFVGRKSGYDYYLMWSLLVQLIKGKRQCGDVRDWDDSFVCSELIADSYFKACGIRFVPACFDVSSTVPDDIELLWGTNSVDIS